ncbi:sensor histidine kinase KdpD [Hyphomonas sp. L-53-1-40]|uniref:sensor histidine kinase n=1 Tax=Hyphomonas sp. L-53-1-40 TaxID=1207058 RepID=UPI0012EC24DD|nr:sensor histidine kinase [Hyphomonas sp. L-53-1-40]
MARERRLEDFHILSETNAQNISANRRALLNVLRKSLHDCEDLIWLADRDGNNEYLALSYCSIADTDASRESPFSEVFVQCSLSQSSDQFRRNCEAAIESITRNLLRRSGKRDLVLHHKVIEDFIDTSADDDHLPSRKILGWFTVAIPKDEVLSNRQERLIEFSSRVLAIALRQGRDNRQLNAIQQIHNILSSSNDPSVALARAEELLMDFCSMSEAKFWTTQSNDRIISGSKRGLRSPKEKKLRGRTVSIDILNTLKSAPEFTLDLDEKSALTVQKQNHLRASTNAGGHQIYEPQDGEQQGYIYIPLVEAGLKIESHKFSPLKDAPKLFEKTSVVSHAITLHKKRSPLFLAGTISATDAKVANGIRRAFQGFFSAALYEEKFTKISEFFQSRSVDAELNEDTLLGFINEFIVEARNIFLLEYKAKSTGETIEQIKLGSSSLPSDYLGNLQAYLRNKQMDQTDTHKPPNGDAVNMVGADLKYERHTLLEFHLNNTFSSNRVLVIDLHRPSISLNDFRILQHLVSELELFFRNRDSVLRRFSDLAQIRHAIIAPVSAANAEIIAFQKVLAASRHSEKQWLRLLKRRNIWEGLDLAVDLGEIAKLLAESGRYLFSRPTHNQLNIKNFDIEVLMHLALQTFNSRRRLQKFVFRQSVVGTPKVHNGDRPLMFVVLVNLLDNAIKYSQPRVSKQYYDRKYPSLNLSDQFLVETKIAYEDDGYRVEVSNVGRYLPARMRRVIFQEFGRGEQTSNLNLSHGTGIGLAAARQILLAHHQSAELKYESKPLEGPGGPAYTTFHFRLPYLIGERNG